MYINDKLPFLHDLLGPHCSCQIYMQPAGHRLDTPALKQDMLVLSIFPKTNKSMPYKKLGQFILTASFFMARSRNL